jgi:hypothetical protein
MPKCLPSLYAVTKPGGFVGVTTWLHLPWYVSHPISSPSPYPSFSFTSLYLNSPYFTTTHPNPPYRQPILATAISRMTDTPAPYNPSATEVLGQLYNGVPWQDEAYVAARLRDAGFERVETETMKYKVDVGSPAMYVTSRTPHSVSEIYHPLKFYHHSLHPIRSLAKSSLGSWKASTSCSPSSKPSGLKTSRTNT